MSKKELEAKVGGSDMGRGKGNLEEDLKKHVSEFNLNELSEESVVQNCLNGSLTHRKPVDGFRGLGGDPDSDDEQKKMDSAEIGGCRKKYLNPNQLPGELNEFSEIKKDRDI